MDKNLLIGNGVNIQHGGNDFSNAAIVLRTLRNYKCNDFPAHIINTEPVLAKSLMGFLFLAARGIINGKYDRYVTCSAERQGIAEFKSKYADKATLKMSDIGFEDYYLIFDLFCHKRCINNPERYYIREALKWGFINAIYDAGRVNTLANDYSSEFVSWIKEFDTIFTTNYDQNIENATGMDVYHLHGDFATRQEIYKKGSFRNQLSDHPADNAIVDENYPYLYSTVLSTFSGDYKQYYMEQSELANSAIENMARAYDENESVKANINNWENDENELVARLHESIVLKVKNPELKFDVQYPIRVLKDIKGELVILGLSPYNDRHLFDLINKTNLEKCTYFYYDTSECSVIKQLLGRIELIFKDVRAFWNTSAPSINTKSNKEHRRRIAKRVSRSDMHKFCEIYRKMTDSIMTDDAIVSQFNMVPYHTRKEICKKIKELKVERELDVDQQFVLSLVDLHIVAGEFKLDPAVIMAIGVDNGKNEIIQCTNR